MAIDSDMVIEPLGRFVGGMLVKICVLAEPRVTVCCENLSSLPSVARGTPNPAESLRKTKEVGEATSEVAIGFVFTAINAGCEGSGACTGTCGAWIGPRPGAAPLPVAGAEVGVKAATLLMPYQPPPGIQPQPTLGQ